VPEVIGPPSQSSIVAVLETSYRCIPGTPLLNVASVTVNFVVPLTFPTIDVPVTSHLTVPLPLPPAVAMAFHVVPS
jgi:hypothetical protein